MIFKMNKAITDIFTKASRNAVDKGRNVLKLKKLYEKYNPVRFREAFLHCCLSLAKHDYKKINPKVERCIQFAAEFCGNCYNSEETDEVDQFVVDVIDNLLLYHNNFQTNFRFYICKITRLIMDRISANLRDDVCDRIQIAMCERMNDHNSAVREQAALAIMRLQRPEVPDCVVISKYIERITSDPNATVRKVIVQKIAMTGRTLSVIFQSIWSVDAAVRSAAYLRCSSQEPCILEIEQRQYLVIQIAFDVYVPNRVILERRLWPKWLDMCRVANNKAASKSSAECSDSPNAMNSHEKVHTSPVEKDNADACLIMLRMLRLDESVDQLQQTYMTFKVVLKVHFKLTPITDLIQALRLDSKKLVPMQELSLESVFYWKYLLKHMQKLEISQDEIVAELAGFCEYIDKYVKKTLINSSSCPYDEFTWLPNQHILLHLLEIVASSDLHDDFGRERLKQLLSDILINLNSIHEDVMTIIVQIYSRIESKFETVCDYFYGIITDIIRPYKAIPLDDCVTKERDFTLAKLKFTLAMAEDTHTAAMEAKDYLRAGECHKDVMSLREKISAVANDAQLLAEHEDQQRLQQQNGRKLREPPTTDRAKQLRCCEMLCVILKLCYRHSHKIPLILYTAKIELLDILLQAKENELFAKAVDTLTYYSLMDKDIAEEAIVIMSSPIITYRLLPYFDVLTLTAALSGFTYILMKYGIKILNNHVTNENENTSNDKQLSQSSNCSRIERVNRIEDVQRLDLENISIEDYQAIILDMLDDENLPISIHAAICITNLLQNNIAANSAVISKILLKWFTPELYKSNPRLLYILSAGISHFGETTIKNIGAIMEEAAMLTLRCIIEAPAESSLYVCDLPKCLQFLASVTMMAEPNKSEIHRNLAQKLIPCLSSDIDIRSKEIYSKFLSYMDAPLFDVDAVRRFDELLQNTETNGLKTVRANISKYLSKLRNIYNGNTTDSLATTAQATISISSDSAITTAHSLPSIIIQPTEMHLSQIDEVNSHPPTPSLINEIENIIPLCSTPINRSRIGERLGGHTIRDKRGSISYHISDIDISDTDLQVNEIVGGLDVQNHASNGISQADADIGVCTMNLERNPNNVDVGGKTKENNSTDKPSPRRRSTSNKRLNNTENEYSEQGSDVDPSNQKNSCPRKKRKLSMRLNLSRSPNNKNDTIHHDTVCSDLEQMQIQNSSSSQSSTTSVFSKKRGRPLKQKRENGITETEGHCNRTSARLNSKSFSDNCRVVITVDAEIHHNINGYHNASSPSRPSCQQPRKRLRLLSRSKSDCRIQNNGQTMTRNGRTNGLISKLQSIENDFDAIDIVTASSSSE